MGNVHSFHSSLQGTRYVRKFTSLSLPLSKKDLSIVTFHIAMLFAEAVNVGNTLLREILSKLNSVH